MEVVEAMIVFVFYFGASLSGATAQSRLVWPSNLSVRLGDFHPHFTNVTVAFNNRFENQALDCFPFSRNFHEEEANAWLMVRLGGPVEIQQVQVNLAEMKAESEAWMEIRVTDHEEGLEFVTEEHPSHIITTFSQWDRFKQCGTQLFMVGEETFSNFTFLCDPPIVASRVAIYLQGRTPDRIAEIALCELSVFVPDCEPSMCAPEAKCEGSRCACPPRYVGSGLNDEFCRRKPWTQGCSEEQRNCRSSLLLSLSQRMRTHPNRTDLIASLSEFDESLSEEDAVPFVTASNIRLLVPLMNEGFLNSSDDDRAEDEDSETLLRRYVSLSDHMLLPMSGWFQIQSQNRMELVESLLDSLTSAAFSVASHLTNGTSRFAVIGEGTAAEAIAPGQRTYHSSSLLGQRLVSLELAEHSRRGVSVVVVPKDVWGSSLLSDVLSVTTEPQTEVSVDLELKHRPLSSSESLHSLLCVFWCPTSRRWSSVGCRRLSTSGSATRCHCDHLTSFALLLDVRGTWRELSDLHRTLHRWLTVVGGFSSAILLFYAIACFAALSHRQPWSFVDLNFCLSLLLAQFLTALSSAVGPGYSKVCAGTGIAMHFLFLCVFAWAMGQGLRMYLKLVHVLPTALFTPDSRRWPIFVVGYGVPACLVAVSVGVSLEDYGPPGACWMTAGSPAMWLFIVPVGAVMAANSVILTLSLYRIQQRTCGRKRKFLNLSKIFFLMSLLGLTWVSGFLAAIEEPHVGLFFSYIFLAAYLSTSLLICVGYRLFSFDVRLCLLQELNRRGMLSRSLRRQMEGMELATVHKNSQSGRHGVTYSSLAERPTRRSTETPLKVSDRPR